jgi:hypothetical protein
MKGDLTGTTAGRGAGSATTGSTGGTAQGRPAPNTQKPSELAVKAAPGSTVDLATHVNHKVELTGTPEKHDMTGGMAGSSTTGTTASTAGRSAGAAGAAHQMDKPTLAVTALNMIAANCAALQ